MQLARNYRIAVIVLVVLSPVEAHALGQVVIAGTGGDPLESTLASHLLRPDRPIATPFTTEAGSAFSITGLQIPARRYHSSDAVSAVFSLYDDSNGVPGAELVTFPLIGLTTSKQIYDLSPSHTQVVLPESRYWIVGRFLSEEVTDSVTWYSSSDVVLDIGFGQDSHGYWAIIPFISPAYALLGVTVPEPSILALLALAGFGGMLRRRRRLLLS